jgi:hypothetical protein
MATMISTLAALLVAAGVAPGGSAVSPVVRHEGASAVPPRRLAGAADVAALCEALTPPERLRAKGDAIERGERESRHADARDEALAARYAVSVSAARLAFAPYDGPEQRLTLAEPLSLVVGPRTKLWTVSERGLPVEVAAAGARRILDAQRAGRLVLAVTFDLPEDAACGADPRLRGATLPIEPVDWRWMDGETVLARGGAGVDRPLVTVAQGARPTVDVGEPIAGPSDVKRAVLARAGALEACYAEALRKDPGVDGVLVMELSQVARPAVAADSTGAPELTACVERALAGLAPLAGGKAAVPIRFELVAPKVAAGAATPAGEAAPPGPAAPAASATLPAGR